MDPANERRVFDLMVAATSQGTDSSQYFILTPKVVLWVDCIVAEIHTVVKICDYMLTGY